ncbi:PQQ-binding-like beta-propeller repeat protein [Cellulomonas sp. JZ18]|uniref:outer membrane protein assembly factor BamB family protein n=1 Tax=Cellulomonas sp. JZ18 TaxID=2654191 RepID=UPI0012D4A12F|nr:PQQ-binding-like beta-propeller repeat protein [Cellulomonas sp. JZ18]QGQ18279.1 PQQ-binding-like beta-propeller repeat protein [Cellulomonas sp. JZ18]
MVQRGNRADVELVEDDEPSARVGATSDAGPGTGRRTARPGRRRLVLAAAAVVVVLVAAQVVSDARERAVLAGLRALPGVLAPVPDALDVRWRTPGDRLPLAVLGTGSALVGVRSTPAGTELAALDPATGADAWALPLTAPPAGARDALGTPVPWCSGSPAPPDALPERVACLATDAWQRDAGLVPQDVPATTSRLVLVDTADGSVVADHVVDAAPGVPATSLALLGDVAVLAHPVADGLLVRAVDATTGAARWTREAAGGSGATALRSTDGGVLVPAPDGLELVDASGTVLRRVPLPPDARADVLWQPDGTPRAVLDAGGPWYLVGRARDVVLPGPPVHVAVDDGRAGPLVLATSEHGLHAVDGTTGDERWAAPVPGVHRALVLRGRVHAVTEEGVTTYDARTGEVVWARERPATEVWGGSVMTDGRDLLVPVADASTGEVLRLDRLALPDGRVGGTVRVPPGLALVTTAGGLLTGWDLAGDGLVALG